jgi:hypothetical protein
MSRWRKSPHLAALAVLVAVSVAILSASFVHTDDGCRVEIHCLACRTMIGSSATGVSAPAPAPPLLLAGPAVPGAPARPSAVPRPRQLPSRAPPHVSLSA